MNIAEKDKIILRLHRFTRVDKYLSFKEAMPGIEHSPAQLQATVTDILDRCALQLIRALEQPTKPTLASLRAIITAHMDEITLADANAENKDFGYELCWFLSEIAQTRYKRISENKLWGFWKVEGKNVKPVTGIRKKRKKD